MMAAGSATVDDGVVVVLTGAGRCGCGAVVATDCDSGVMAVDSGTGVMTFGSGVIVAVACILHVPAVGARVAPAPNRSQRRISDAADRYPGP